jgi:hypothetical protein
VLGDAVAAFNPVYGHGRAVAAQGAVALRSGSCRPGGGVNAGPSPPSSASVADAPGNADARVEGDEYIVYGEDQDNLSFTPDGRW